MAEICFYFQVHQPYRVKKYSVFHIGEDHNYFETDDPRLSNAKIFHKVAHKCYIPTNALILDLLKKYPDMRVSYSLSGVFLEQAEAYYPEVIESFKRLFDTGQAELLEETYHHSLSFLYSPEEFRRQILQHRAMVQRLFGITPEVFRNTELIYNNYIAEEVEKLGYKGILAEGVDRILDWRNPNFVYKPVGAKNLKLLLKNYKLSDDIAFRFSNQGWDEYPLTADKYAKWIHKVNGSGHIVNLFMDYETFGEHQWEHTGIFDFMRHLPHEILKDGHNGFVTPSEAIAKYDHADELDFPHFVSWADSERDLSAWYSNDIQKDAMKKVYSLEKKILATNDEALIEDWRKLTTSDHFYYMCTKYFADGDVHKYFNPYESPYEAFIQYMNIMADLEHRAAQHRRSKRKAKADDPPTEKTSIRSEPVAETSAKPKPKTSPKSPTEAKPKTTAKSASKPKSKTPTA